MTCHRSKSVLPINGRLEAMNSLSNVIYGVKKQLADQEGFSGKLEDDDKQSSLALVKETMEQVAGEGATALLEAVEEKLAQVRAQINPIARKLYEGAGGYALDLNDDAQEPFRPRNEL